MSEQAKTRSATTRRATITLAALATLAATPMGTAGCFKQTPVCAALDSCGGDLPVGDWTLNSTLDPSSSSCSEDLYTPPADTRLVQAELPPARTAPPEPALYDWCDLLVTGPNIPVANAAMPTPKPTTDNSIVVRLPTFSFETFPIGAATIHYDASHHYVLSTTRTGTFSLDFPAYCMRNFGAVDTPLDPAALPAATGTVCDKLQAALRAIAPAKYRNVSCQLDPRDPAGQEGCVCGFDVADTQVSSGSVVPQGNDMIHLPGTDFPEDVTYCVQGQRLQLTGGDGSYLFDRLGLRTLDMVKVTVNCTDGMQGPGEDGVDCGPACPMLCPTM